MTKRFILAALISLFFLGSQSQAYEGLDLIDFNTSEIAAAQKYGIVVAKTASQCLERTYDEHIEFYKKYGFSKFYGNRRYSETDIRNFLKSKGHPELMSQIENMSCIDLTRKCLKKAFVTHNMRQIWTKLDEFTVKNGVSGMALLEGLQRLGWKIYYWNPSTNIEKMKHWDDIDYQLTKDSSQTKVVSWDSGHKNSSGQYVSNPVWGYHVERYQSVMKKNRYYLANVDDKESLVGFWDEEPQWLQNVDFFVGVAHAGYHVFPGMRGKVVEAHSTRSIESIDNIQQSPFNPLANGGGPRWTKTERYLSGIIAIPPGY